MKKQDNVKTSHHMSAVIIHEKKKKKMKSKTRKIMSEDRFQLGHLHKVSGSQRWTQVLESKALLKHMAV